MKVLVILTIIFIIINIIKAKESYNSGRHNIKSGNSAHEKQKNNFKRSNLHLYENQIYPDAYNSLYGYGQIPGFFPEAKFHKPTIVSNSQLHYGFPHHLHIDPTAAGIIQSGVPFALPAAIAPELPYPGSTQYVIRPGGASVSSYSATYPQFHYQNPHYKVPIVSAPASGLPVHFPVSSAVPVHLPVSQQPVIPIVAPEAKPVLQHQFPTVLQHSVVVPEVRPVFQNPISSGFHYHIQQNIPATPIIPAPATGTAITPIKPVAPIAPVTPITPVVTQPSVSSIIPHNQFIPNTFFFPRPFVQRPVIIIGSQPQPTESVPSVPTTQVPEILPVGSGSAILPGQIPPQTTVSPPTSQPTPNIPWRPIVINNNPTNIPSPSSNRPSVTLVPPYGRQPVTLEEFEIAYYNEDKPSGSHSHKGYHYK